MPAFPPPEVLCAYLEPLASGARIVILGDSASGAAEQLAAAGARAVHVYDPDHLRARSTPSRGRVIVGPLPQHGDIDVRDGAFDVALVPDLAAIPDALVWLARLRRVLGADGALLVAAANPDAVGAGIGYYDLFDMVAMQFACVRMVAALPFRGTTLAEIGQEEEPEVTVETGLAVEAPPALAFVAFAAQRDDLRLAPYAIVQQPPVDADVEPPTLAPLPPPPDLSAVEAELAEARLRADVLERRVDEERARVRDTGLQVSHLGRRNAELEAALAEGAPRLAQMEAAYAEAAARVAELEAAFAEAQARAAELEAAFAEAQARGAELESALADTSERLDLALRAQQEQRAHVDADVRHRVAALERELEEAHRRLASERSEHGARLERAFAEGEARGHATAQALADEITVLEQRVRERAGAVKELEREVRRREKIVKELLQMLEEAQQGGPIVPAAPAEDLRPRLDALALDLARRESDLEAARWRVAELEQRLARPEAAEAPAPAPSAPAGEEVEVLRQALAQEHEARRRAESGEALTRAREELQRQAVLIEQLSRELGGDQARR